MRNLVILSVIAGLAGSLCAQSSLKPGCKEVTTRVRSEVNLGVHKSVHEVVEREVVCREPKVREPRAKEPKEVEPKGKK